MNDQVLQNIGRKHSAAQVVEAYRLARKEGFDEINIIILVEGFSSYRNDLISRG